MISKDSVRVIATLKKTDYEKLKAKANCLNRSISNYIQTLILKDIER